MAPVIPIAVVGTAGLAALAAHNRRATALAQATAVDAEPPTETAAPNDV